MGAFVQRTRRDPHAVSDTTFHYRAADGTSVFARRWRPAGSVRAAVQIAHGAAEHSERYDRFARFLNAHQYAVYANDHRGHGQTRVRSGALGDAGPDAWNQFVGDARELTRVIRNEMPGQPIVLFGHSMGSFIAQDYLARYGAIIDGIVLCATNGVFSLPPDAAARLDMVAANDPLGASAALKQRWDTYNDAFEPGKAGHAWLSRDAVEVQKYVDDPLCGFPFGNELTRDFLKGLSVIFQPERESKIPRDVPMLVIAGDQDPVGGNSKGIVPLLDRYRSYGVRRLTSKFYSGARHELLNETNRDEVQADILAWLQSIT